MKLYVLLLLSLLQLLHAVILSHRKSVIQVIMEVESKLNINFPLAGIQKVIQDFKDSVTKEQETHYKVYTSQKEICISETEYTYSDIQKSENSMTQAKQKLDKCKNDLQIAQKNYQTTQKVVEQAQERYEVVVANEKQEENEYQDRKAEYEDAVSTIKTILKLLNQKTGIKEIQQLTKKMVHQAINIEATTQYAPVIQQLTQLKMSEKKLSDKDFAKNIDMMRQLEVIISKSFNSYQQTYDDLHEVLVEQKDRLHDQITQVKDKLYQHREDVDRASECIGEQMSTINYSESSVQRDSKVLVKADALCQTFESDYKQASDQRKKELSLIAELEQKVEKRAKEQYRIIASSDF